MAIYYVQEVKIRGNARNKIAHYVASVDCGMLGLGVYGWGSEFRETTTEIMINDFTA